MLPLNTLSQLRDRVLDLLQGARSQADQSNSPLSSDRVVNNILSAYSDMTAMGHVQMRHEFLEYENVQLSSSTTGQLDIRWNPQRGQIVWLTWRNESDTTPSQEERIRILSRLRNKEAYTTLSSYYRNTSGEMFVYDTSRTYWRIWYLRYPAPLHMATVATSGSNSANALVMPSSATLGTVYARDDEYNGSRIYISSGTNSGYFARITDFTGSTRLATLASDTAITGDALPSANDNTTVYSILPWFPEEWHDLLCHLAAIKFKNRPGAMELQEDAASKLVAFTNWLDEQDETRSLGVRNEGNMPSYLDQDNFSPYRQATDGTAYF